MKVLGIETSCDESAISILECAGDNSAANFKILGNALASQAAMHAQYGGVFPAMAKKEHAKNLTPLLEIALKESGLAVEGDSDVSPADIASLETLLQREPELYAQLSLLLPRYKIPDIDCIAVTTGPGLEPCLWVGINYAKALARVWKKPVVSQNHMEGHIIASMVQGSENEVAMSGVEFPVVSLLVSGGHTELILSKEFGAYQYLGRTRDDAVGEAYDKVARMMDLPYPGGPHISKLADAARAENLKSDLEFTRPMLREPNYDFSFSGLKTAVSKVVTPTMSEEDKKKIAREFEDCVSDTLVGKTKRAIDEFGANTVVLGGGVSANKHLRKRFSEEFADLNVLLSEPSLATDNAVMIALAGYFHALKKDFADAENMVANGSLKLT